MEQSVEAVAVLRPTRPPWARAMVSLRRFVRTKPMGAVGLGIVGFSIVVSLVGPFFTPYDPWEIHRGHGLEAPSSAFWFGTDSLGRDVFSRTVYGAQVSIYVGIVTMLVAAASGLTFGVSSAYMGGKFDLITQRIVDGIIGIPTLILALALVAALGQSLNNIILAIAIVQIPRMTRVIRSTALSIKETPYIDSARAIGSADLRIMVRHVVPNTFGPLLIIATSAIGAIIITESTLSFLGLGVDPETITWGALLSGDTRIQFAGAPWLALGPGFALTFVVFGVNMLGDALRDVLDPKLRGR